MPEQAVKQRGGTGAAKGCMMVAWLFWLIAAVCGPLMLRSVWLESQELESMTVTAEGVIVKLEKDRDGDTSVERPWVTFEHEGETVRFVSRDTWNREVLAVGQEVPVVYNVDNPSVAEMKEASLSGRLWATGVLGVTCVLIGLWGLVGLVRRLFKRPAPQPQ